MKYKYLFTPAKIGSLELKNRCIMAPMSAALANPDGTVSDELIAYFVARAKGGMGLIMTGIRLCAAKRALLGPSDFRGGGLHDSGACASGRGRT